MKNKLVMPFLKWVGGKRQLLTEINNLIPSKYSDYYEPFIGGGAVLFNLQPKNAFINDFNIELINVYKVIKAHPNELIEDLKRHENNSDYFYSIRSLDRCDKFKDLTLIERASRVIYLNKTCYNGLYRVNNSGEFNSPFGNYKNPNIVNLPVIKAVSEYLNNNNIQIFSGDFEIILKSAKKGDFVYLDPPYDPISKSSNFTGYVQGGFNEMDQLRLSNICKELNDKGVKFLLSNSATKRIEGLYKDFEIIKVDANRFINSNSAKRGKINELLIRNYD